MDVCLVLAMHGAPPNDFPRNEITELFGLSARLRHMAGEERAAAERRVAALDAKVRAWPRTPRNDPYHAAALVLGEELGKATGHQVIVAFNEFCAPSLDEALDQAAARGVEKVVVVTPMTTRGGEHSEVEIPNAVKRAEERHPGTSFVYVWPLEAAEVARFLAGQIKRFL